MSRHYKGDKKGRKGNKKAGKSEKLKQKIQKFIDIGSNRRADIAKEDKLLQQQGDKLNQLLSKVDDMDQKEAKDQLKSILRSHKDNLNRQKQQRKKKNQAAKERLKNKKERKERKKREKREKKERKQNKKGKKHGNKKQRKKLTKEEKQAKKEKRQEIKKYIKEAQINTFPSSSDVNGKFLTIHVDGYNLLGCDKIARNLMRKKGKGAKDRVITLLQEYYNGFNNQEGTFSIKIILWFDGRGKNTTVGNIEIRYSQNGIVDDKLVELFTKNIQDNKEDDNINNDYLVITSDRELCVRLYKVGIQCMKSSVFYKQEMKKINKNIKKQDDEKETEYETVESAQFEMEGDETQLTRALSSINHYAANDDDDDSDTDDEDEEEEGSVDSDDSELDQFEYELEGDDFQPGAPSKGWEDQTIQ